MLPLEEATVFEERNAILPDFCAAFVVPDSVWICIFPA